MADFLIYGATGYTGSLIAHEAVRRGYRPILAGRNAEALAALARKAGLDQRVFPLDDFADRRVNPTKRVLHAAGSSFQAMPPPRTSVVRRSLRRPH